MMAHQRIELDCCLLLLLLQRLQDWKSRFEPLFGLRCAELTGDSVGSSLRELASSNLIFTTPEKFSGISAQWVEHIFLLAGIR